MARTDQGSFGGSGSRVSANALTDLVLEAKESVFLSDGRIAEMTAGVWQDLSAKVGRSLSAKGIYTYVWRRKDRFKAYMEPRPDISAVSGPNIETEDSSGISDLSSLSATASVHENEPPEDKVSMTLTAAEAEAVVITLSDDENAVNSPADDTVVEDDQKLDADTTPHSEEPGSSVNGPIEVKDDGNSERSGPDSVKSPSQRTDLPTTSRPDPVVPRRPAPPYITFSNDHRAKIRQMYPDMDHRDQSRTLGQMWKDLNPAERKKYDDQWAEQWKIYSEQLAEYRKTPGYKEPVPVKRKRSVGTNAKRAKKDSEDGNTTKRAKNEVAGVCEGKIPIFTKEFLEHNKSRDSELRSLRRQAAELEEELANLEAHDERVNGAVATLVANTGKQKELNKEAEAKLAQISDRLLKAFHNKPLPNGTHKSPTPDTVVTYMTALSKLIDYESDQYEEFISDAKQIVANINFS